MNSANKFQVVHQIHPPLPQRFLSFLFNSHPSITDIGEIRKARLTIILAGVLTLTNSIGLLFVARQNVTATFYLQIILVFVTLLSFLLSRGYRFMLGGITLIASLLLSGFANIMIGSDDPIGALNITLPIAFAIGFAILPVWGNVIQYLASLLGLLILPVIYTPFTYSDVGKGSPLIVTLGLLLIVVQVFRDSLEKERLAEVQNINQELRELGATLEQRVTNRTNALQASVEVTRRLTMATSPRQLAVDVVEQVQSAFNYYHAHIYFIDEGTGDLVMVGGTGEAGATMLARGHKVPKGRGLVGRAADTNAPVLVPDVSKAEGWLHNPLLPETRSEIAIPIAAGNQVMGVLDVQQNIVNGLGQEDVELLQSLAAQVAISLQNVRSFEESRAQAELEAMVNLIGQKIQRSATVDEALQTAARELGLALGAPRVKAAIGNPGNAGKGSITAN